MPVDLIKLHEKTYGYNKRTGKRGHYKYWYKDSSHNKLYEGKKPPKMLLEYFPTEAEHPSPDEIIDNPWENYNSTNIQMVFCRETNVPFNKIGSTSKQELEHYESYLLSVSYRRIFEKLKTFPEYYLPIDSSKIKMLHKVIFDDLYDWAGEFRNIHVSKEGFPFPPGDMVIPEMKRLDKELFNKIDYGSEASLEELAELLSMVSSELTIVHPFREGNGRIVRIVTDIITIAFNHNPANWGVLDSPADKDKYLQCMFSGYKKSYKPLTEFIYDLLESARS
ncbi:MAG: Fic/DOC family protein [Vampirovibrionia bacterium]